MFFRNSRLASINAPCIALCENREQLAHLAHLSTHDVQYFCWFSTDRGRANLIVNACFSSLADLAMLAHFSRRRRKAMQDMLLPQ
jgi:hypothetical protein